MKLKDVIPMLGFRPTPRTYGYKVEVFELPKDGQVFYAQWLHPREKPKLLKQQAVDELRTFLRPGDVALDIGAHTGDTTLPIALAAGPTGCVLALEPNPYVFPVLDKNADLNGDKTRIIPLMFAATPNDGEYDFEYSDRDFCNGGLHEGMSRWRHGHAYKLRVLGRNLVAFLQSEYSDLIPRLRYIKVDTEGFDHTVLRSLTSLIVANRPYIRAEVFKHTSRAQREQLLSFLFTRGYTVLRIASDLCYRGEQLGVQDVMRWRHFDLFCIPGDDRSANRLDVGE